MDVTEEWYWEGNVVEAIAQFLAQGGWTIISKADTRSKERGVDIHARKDGATLLVEAKGFPSKNYRDSRRASEVKPTNPTKPSSAVVLTRPTQGYAVADELPRSNGRTWFPRFPSLSHAVQENQGGLAKLGLAMLTVRADGTVETWGYAAPKRTDKGTTGSAAQTN
jgi:hypothetical protein